MAETRKRRTYKKVLVAMKKSTKGHLRGYVKLNGSTYRLYPSASNKAGVEGWIEVALIKSAPRSSTRRRSSRSSRSSGSSRSIAAGKYFDGQRLRRHAPNAGYHTLSAAEKRKGDAYELAQYRKYGKGGARSSYRARSSSRRRSYRRR